MSLGDGTGAGSTAMGDALERVALPAIVLDEYNRAFEADLAGTLRSAEPASRLANAVGGSQRAVSISSAATSLAFSIDDRGRFGELRLGENEAEPARVLAARVATKLAPDLKLGFGYAEGADGLVATLQGQDRPAFLIAPDASGDSGTLRHTAASVALRKQVGPWGLTVSSERGETLSGAAIRRAAEMSGHRVADDVASTGLAVDRRFGSLDTTLGVTWMDEQHTLLGGRFHDNFGLTGADTLFLDAGAGWNFVSGWRLGGNFRQGWTSARAGGLVAPGSRLTSRAWSLDLERRGVFGDADSLGFRVSQPLRVESGALNLSLPVGYDYATELAEYGVRSLALAPRGRETMAELAWRGPLLTGYGAASLFYRKDPGHYASLPDDNGVALRWSKSF